MTDWQMIKGIIEKGHQVASGLSPHSPYPQGTIELQTPFFQALGLDISMFFPGTLNVSLLPHTYHLKNPQYTFLAVNWSSYHPPENFSFSPCFIIHNQTRYPSLVYYPHPETKQRHWQNNSIIEILAPHLPELQYGNEIFLEINLGGIQII